MNENPYTLTRTLHDPPDRAQERVIAALADQGFGILSTIDVHQALKDKLGHEMGIYRILGACNPELARRAIDADPDIGALLPCNVLLRENATGGTDVVAADPAAMLALAAEAPTDVAEEARTRLVAALDAVAAPG